MHKNAAMSNLDGEFLATIVLTNPNPQGRSFCANPNLQASSFRAKRGISLRSKPRATDRALTTHTPSQPANYFPSRESSKRQFHRAKQRKQSLPAINIAKTIARRKHRRASSQHNIFRERRAIGNVGDVVYADRVANGRLQQNKFERFSAFEA